MEKKPPPPPANRLPDDVRKSIGDDLEAGMTRGDVATKYGVSQSTASRIAKERGVAPSQPPELTLASKTFLANVKERRAQLKDDLLVDIQRLRQRAWSEYTRTVAGKDGPYEITEELPPLSEVRNAYAAIGVAVTSYTKLEALDVDTTEEDEAKSLIDRIAAGLTKVNEELEAREAAGQHGADVPEDEAATINVVRGDVIDRG